MTKTTEDYQTLWETAQATIEQLQDDLAMAQQSYVNLFENAGDSILITNLSDFIILDANEHAARRLGYPRDKLVGMSLKDVEIYDPDTATSQNVWESSTSGTLVYECHHRHRDGHLIPVEVSSRVVMMAGRTVILSFVRNIEVRRRLEAEREQFIADLDSFAHTVAHDIKNPLALILGYANLLEEMYEDFSAEELREHLRAISLHTRRTSRIVDELLLFASVRKQEDIQRTPLDMSAILGEAESRLSESIAQKGAKILYPARWDVALGYAPWVLEMWVNYLSNAIKYGGTPPVIELGSTVEPNRMVRFWVRDNGKGIAPESLPRLFNQFTRLNIQNTDGQGLGLSIVKRIAEKLGGTVGVESFPDKGSVFSFLLPAYG